MRHTSPAQKILNIVPDTTLLGSIIVAHFISNRFPEPIIIPNPANFIAGWIITAAGACLALYSIYLIKAANKTSYVTDTPPDLMTKGVFAFSRNPFYLGYAIAATGAAIIYGTLAAFAAPVIYFAIINFWVIPFEEKTLRQKFGQKYQGYKKSVRRWL